MPSSQVVSSMPWLSGARANPPRRPFSATPTGPRRSLPWRASSKLMDYALNVILAVCGAFTILTIALLLWVANLLLKVAELERALRKARAWADYQLRHRRERL